jgi:hypothetical protein
MDNFSGNACNYECDQYHLDIIESPKLSFGNGSLALFEEGKATAIINLGEVIMLSDTSKY